MSTVSRLSKLERAHLAAPPELTGEDAVIAGTASLEQYGRVFAGEIARHRLQVVEQAPAIAAMVHSRRRFSSWPKNAVAYPPDRPLPEYEASRLASLERGASRSAMTVPEGRRGTSPNTSRPVDPAERAGDSILLLAMGGHEALELRRKIWMTRDSVWTFTADVWALAEDGTFYRHALGDYHDAGMPYLCQHSKAHSIGPACYVTFADVARHVGIPEFEQLQA